MTWFVNAQLVKNFQTFKASLGTYVIEVFVLVSAIFALRLFNKEPATIVEGDETTKCGSGDVGNPTELLMDLVILASMRSLRVLAAISFALCCGPCVGCAYFFTRPKAPVSAKQLNQLFVKVTIDQLNKLRSEKNYRHTTIASQTVTAENIDLEFHGHTHSQDETCAICMDDFHEDDYQRVDRTQVVLLPCKAHFFHEPCITEWMKKQN